MSLSFNAPEVMDLLLKDIAGQFMMKIKKAADVPERMVKMLIAFTGFFASER